jgi:hypothetical protein
MVSLTTGTLKRLSVDSGAYGGLVGVPMQLRQGLGGVYKAVVPAGVTDAGEHDQHGIEAAKVGEEMPGRSHSSILRRKEAAMLAMYLEQANEEREYEVSCRHDCWGLLVMP